MVEKNQNKDDEDQLVETHYFVNVIFIIDH